MGLSNQKEGLYPLGWVSQVEKGSVSMNMSLLSFTEGFNQVCLLIKGSVCLNMAQLTFK